jgi:hypothetical protein
VHRVHGPVSCDGGFSVFWFWMELKVVFRGSNQRVSELCRVPSLTSGLERRVFYIFNWLLEFMSLK